MVEFIIAFREALEASVIVGIIYCVLIQSQAKTQLKKLWAGVYSAILASCLVAVLMIQLKKIFGNNAYEALFEGLFLYLTAGFIYYVIFWLSKHASNTKAIKEKTTNAMKLSGSGIFFLTFFAILREGFETVIFLLSSFSIKGSFSYFGFFLGIILAVLIGYFIIIQGQKIGLKIFFKITTLSLVLFASGMIAYGTHEIEEFLVKSNHVQEEQISRPWNILQPIKGSENKPSPILFNYNEQKGAYIHVLHDKGSVGVFLKGFLGYNSNPNYIELLLWILSLIFGYSIWHRTYSSRPLKRS